MLFLLHAHVCCRWIWKYSHHSSAHCIGLEAIDNTWRQHLSSADVLCFDVIWLLRQKKIASKPRDYDGVGMRSIDVGFVCVSRYSMKTKAMKYEDISNVYCSARSISSFIFVSRFFFLRFFACLCSRLFPEPVLQFSLLRRLTVSNLLVISFHSSIFVSDLNHLYPSGV